MAENDTGNVSAMRSALEKIKKLNRYDLGCIRSRKRREEFDAKILEIEKVVRAALAALPHKGRWKNGRSYEYEYAYCSECGRMQWAGWDTHRQAEENIGSFADDYRFCPSCGAEMEGGVYVK